MVSPYRQRVSVAWGGLAPPLCSPDSMALANTWGLNDMEEAGMERERWVIYEASVFLCLSDVKSIVSN